MFREFRQKMNEYDPSRRNAIKVGAIGALALTVGTVTSGCSFGEDDAIYTGFDPAYKVAGIQMQKRGDSIEEITHADGIRCEDNGNERICSGNFRIKKNGGKGDLRWGEITLRKK
ncbi:MAG: hypothetical protein ABIE22_00435 [archaeon]